MTEELDDPSGWGESCIGALNVHLSSKVFSFSLILFRIDLDPDSIHLGKAIRCIKEGIHISVRT